MCQMLLAQFNLVMDNEYAPSYWRKGLIVSLFKKGIGKALVSIEI